MTEYKTILNSWHKGTGGGPGLYIYFQTWSHDKLNKYDIDLENYDHTEVGKRPPILFDNYINNPVKKPQLTIIYLWDHISHNQLSSKFDPFSLNDGEVGCNVPSNDDESDNLNTAKKKSPSSNEAIYPNKGTPKKRKYEKKPPIDSGEADEISIAVKGVLGMLKTSKE